MTSPATALRRRAALAALLAGGLLGAARIAAAEPPEVVTITAHRFEFSPAEVTVEAGKPVILRLTSQDVTHGFYSFPLGLDELIEPGKVLDVTITPPAAGRYTVICDHFCGAGHGNMKMVIVAR